MKKIVLTGVLQAALCLGPGFLLFGGDQKQSTKDPNTAQHSAQAPQKPKEDADPVDWDEPKVREAKKGLDQPVLQEKNPRYRLRFGDVIELKFPLTPEFDQNVTVQPDGFIPLLNVGDLHVEGKTKAELEEMLKKAYVNILRDPVVSIKVLDFEKPYFIVGGQVDHPGKYDMRGNTTVSQAVTIAGGLTDEAKHSQVLLFRRVSDEWVSVTEVNIKKMFNKGDLTEDLELRPGDMVFVPKSFMAKIKAYVPRSEALVWLGLGRTVRR